MKTSTMIAASAFAATLAPTVIAAPIVSNESQSGSVELSEREPFLPLLGLAAGAIGSLFGGRKRDLGDDLDLAEHEPFLPKYIKDKVSKRDLGDDFELAEREPFFPLLGLAAGAIGSIFGGRKRDLGDDLDLFERNLFFTNHLNKRSPLDDDFDLIERDSSDIELSEREPFFPLLGLAAGAIGSLFGGRKRDLEGLELDIRNYIEELEARDYNGYNPPKDRFRNTRFATTLNELD